MSAYPLFSPLLISLTLSSLRAAGEGAEATPVPHGLSRPSSHAASAAGEGAERDRRGAEQGAAVGGGAVRGRQGGAWRVRQPPGKELGGGGGGGG
uniref:Uncharacterized protein n=1 Tax=Oryza nivara TaxID=4536 RepID=A0A0E0HX89_ORYNI